MRHACPSCPVYRTNPAWTNHALFSHWEEIYNFVGPRGMPKLSSKTAKKLVALEYGTGHYGTVIPTETPGLVIKITSDPTEAAFVRVSLGFRTWPAGLIPYHAVFRLTGVHRDRPIYIIWRDEAFDVGKWVPRYLKTPRDQQTLVFVRRLHQYYSFANGVGSVFWKSKKLNLARQNALIAYDHYYGTIGDVDRLAKGSKQLDALIKTKKGADRAGFCIAGCRTVSETMSSESVGDAVGETYLALFENGVILADVHTKNIGRNDPGPGGVLVVTDPGHAIFLTNRFDDVDPLPIEEAKAQDWRR